MAEIKTILSKTGKKLSFVHHKGTTPGVIFMGGYAADMEGSKALHLEKICLEKGISFTRFDYSGHGISEGKFEDGTIEEWFEDTLTIFDQVTEGKQVVVGSSMGGWMMLNTLKHRKDRIHGLIGIAPAPDFTTFLVEDQLTEAHRETLNRDGILIIPPSTPEDNPTIITKKLVKNGPLMFVMDKPLHCPVPMHLLHSMKDDAVPYKLSLDIANHVDGENVKVTILKDGDHRLNRDQDLALLTRTLESMFE